MKCVKCGYESSAPFTKCPSCGAAQSAPQQGYDSQKTVSSVQTRSLGENIAIGVGIAVSVFSVLAAFVIFVGYTSYLGTQEKESYGIDAFDDFDSNDYGDDIENFFRDYYNTESQDDSSTGLNMPLNFKDELKSFSEGKVQSEYEVSMVQTYRGQAALKLLEGDTLPTFDDFSNEIYLVKFKVVITQQSQDAIVLMPQGDPSAYRSGSSVLFAQKYAAIDQLNYANRVKLVRKGEEVETWMAFIVSKDDQSPCVRWKSTVNKEFRNTGNSITDPQEVESGAAIEPKNAESSDDDTQSD